MLQLVTGTPGACKTAYVVTQLDQLERKNKTNLAKNKLIFEHNNKFIDKYQDDFSYIVIEVGSGHELKNEIHPLPNDYFHFLGQDFDDLRPDYYFQRTVHFNEIIDRINDREGFQDFQMFQPVRTIYSNIKALKIDFVRANVRDWRICPDGSVIAIDEVQLVEPYSNLKGKDDIVQELTIHRHRGFDFWFITQAPSLLHPTIKELIGVHFHLTRPWGRTPKVYRWGSTRAYPNTFINKLNCEAKFNFKPADRIFKLYKSTTIDTHQKRFPVGLIGFGIFVLFGFSIFGYGLSGGSGFLGHFFGVEKKPTQQVIASTSGQDKPIEGTKPTGNNQQGQSSTYSPELLDDLETKKIKFELQKRYSHNFQLVSYNPLLHVSGVIMFKGQCKAVNHYSEEINMSNAECLQAFKQVTATRESQDSRQNTVGLMPGQEPQKIEPNQQTQLIKTPEITQIQSPHRGVVIGDRSKEIIEMNKKSDDAWAALKQSKA